MSERVSLLQKQLVHGEMAYQKVFRVGIIGSGNWGTAVAKVVAENCNEKTNLFKSEVRMWVREEKVDGRNLTDIINTEHENVRYLQGIKLPENLKASPDLRSVASEADILVINIPHQFLVSVCDQLEGIDFSRKVAISCLKGIHVGPDGVSLLSDYIYDRLKLHTGALSGANIAMEVAKRKFSETTVAFPPAPNFEKGDPDEILMKQLFQRPYFHVQVSQDVSGCSISGALKNVVAIGSGLVEGAGWGDNARAAIMRRGLLEMIHFGIKFFPNTNMNTFTHESAGVADLITSCAGGRNAKVGRRFAEAEGKLTAEEVEQEVLNGQSAQGLVTLQELHLLLSNKSLQEEFPLFSAIYDVIYNKLPISALPDRMFEEF